MKKLLLCSAIICASNFLYAQDCKKLKELHDTFLKEKYAEQIVTKTTRIAISIVLKKMIGHSAGLLAIFEPTWTSQNLEIYMASARRLNALINTKHVDVEKIKKECENLTIAANGIFIERELGTDEECYKKLEDMTREICTGTQKYILAEK